MARASAAVSTAGRRAGVSRFVLPERAARLVYEANWIALTAIALFLFLILITYDKADPGWSHAALSRTVHNAGGRLGAWLADLMNALPTIALDGLAVQRDDVGSGRIDARVRLTLFLKAG